METEKISMDLDENDFLPSLCQTLRRLANYFKIPHHVMAQWKLEALWIWLTIFILDQSSRLLNIMKATEQLRYKNIFAGLYWFLLPIHFAQNSLVSVHFLLQLSANWFCVLGKIYPVSDWISDDDYHPCQQHH